MDSCLGPMAGRVKTDVRIPVELRHLAQECSDYLGLPLNAVVVLALAQFLAVVSPTWAGKRRAKILEELEIQFRTIIKSCK